MKRSFKCCILFALLLCGCSANNNLIYKGIVKGKETTIHFENHKKGYLLIDNRDSIPFRYKIEMIKVNSAKKKKVNTYVYRFTMDASYKLDYPLGLFEIGQKRSNVLQLNDSIIFVKQ